MLKKLLLGTVPLALVATPAFAATGSDTGTVAINGTVAARCLFTLPSATINLNELAQSGTSTAAGTLNTSVVDGRSVTLAGWCNSTAATMTVQATPLVNTASAATGFTNTVNYLATATANGISATASSTSATAGAPANVNMFTGDITVGLSESAATGLLVAGDYAGTITVTLSPAVNPV